MVAGEVVAAELAQELDAGGAVLEVDLFRHADVLLASRSAADLLLVTQPKELGEGELRAAQMSPLVMAAAGVKEDVDILRVDAGAARAHAVDDEVALELELVVGRESIDPSAGADWGRPVEPEPAPGALGEVLGVAELRVPREGASGRQKA